MAAPFVGVEFIARAVNLSPTKLKMIFKNVFGFSMLQYHKEKNMLIRLLLIPGLFILSCGSTKTNQSLEKKDSLVNLTTEGENAIPPCIKKKIGSFKLKQKHEQPQKVLENVYKGKKVYYVEMPCCDFFNELYDSNCRLLGHPDGGFTGKGDGKLTDFSKDGKSGRMIWKNN